jgi:hypothetical protein
MIQMSVYFSSLMSTRSTWPDNGRPRSGPFFRLLHGVTGLPGRTLPGPALKRIAPGNFCYLLTIPAISFKSSV